MRRCLCFAGLKSGRANPPRHGERARGSASPRSVTPRHAARKTSFKRRQADHPLRWEGAAGASVLGMLACMIERSLLGWRADHAEKSS